MFPPAQGEIQGKKKKKNSILLLLNCFIYLFDIKVLLTLLVDLIEHYKIKKQFMTHEKNGSSKVY